MNIFSIACLLTCVLKYVRIRTRTTTTTTTGNGEFISTESLGLHNYNWKYTYSMHYEHILQSECPPPAPVPNKSAAATIPIHRSSGPDGLFLARSRRSAEDSSIQISIIAFLCDCLWSLVYVFSSVPGNIVNYL